MTRPLRRRAHTTRSHHPGRRYARAAAIAAVGIAAITVLIFAKSTLFASGYTIRAVFSTAEQLKGGSPVRVDGIDVGQVSSVQPGPGNTSRVDLLIGGNAPAIHADATLTVKPRLVLEGNDYIDLGLGTPGAPRLPAGGTIPLSQTSSTVQLDQVLDTLNQPVRNSLHSSVSQLADGLGTDRRGAPQSGGVAGLRSAVQQLEAALPSVSQVAAAARGTTPGDLPRAIDATGSMTYQLAENPTALADLVSNTSAVTQTLAGEYRNLAASLRGLDQLFITAPGSLAAVNGALPALTRAGNALRPTLTAATPALRATNALLQQLHGAIHRDELPALLDRLAPITSELPSLEQRLRTLFEYTTPVTNCITSHVLPVLNAKLQDGANTTGDPVWLDLLHAFTGFTSIATAVDGNGGTVRVGFTEGASAIQGISPLLGSIVGISPQIQGVRPAWLGYGVEPPYRPDQACATQPLPNLNTPGGPAPSWDKPSMRRALKP